MADERLAFVPKLARKARLRFDRHSGGYMIIYPERGLALNESAAAIAKRCDGTLTVGQIAELVASEANETNHDQVTREVLAFVDELGRKGLLER